jgi:hypothetical protein
MAADLPVAGATDAELLYHYLGRRLSNGGRNESVDHLLREFAEYRRELDLLRASLRKAETSSAQGQSRPLDVEDVIRRGRERMAKEGIVD